MIDVLLHGDGNRIPKVTDEGELVMSTISHNSVVLKQLTVANTGVMFIPPVMGKKIIITNILLGANKDVSSQVESDVVIYQSSSGIGETVKEPILGVGILKQILLPLAALNLEIPEGVWVMAKCTDAIVTINIFYYYV